MSKEFCQDHDHDARRIRLQALWRPRLHGKVLSRKTQMRGLGEIVRQSVAIAIIVLREMYALSIRIIRGRARLRERFVGLNRQLAAIISGVQPLNEFL